MFILQQVGSNKVDEELKRDLRTHLSFLIIILINSFCY